MHDPFNRIPVSPAARHHTRTECLLMFTAGYFGDSSSHTGGLGWEAWCWAGTPHSSVGSLQPGCSSQLLTVTWLLRQSVLHLCPSYQSQHGFCISLVVGGVLFSKSSGGSQGWLFYKFICSFDVVMGAGEHSVDLHCHLEVKSNSLRFLKLISD